MTQTTAWFLNHRIRVMLTEKNPKLLSGIVELDQTHVGGKISNKHVSKRKAFKGFDNKTMVLGAVQRGGKVKTKVIPQTTTENIQKEIENLVEHDNTMVSDEHKAHSKLHLNYKHEQVNHRSREYVRGNVHTNTIEGYWNILKKQIVGIHHSVSPKHLQRYCNESAFRYNNKLAAQDERFADALANCEGRINIQN